MDTAVTPEMMWRAFLEQQPAPAAADTNYTAWHFCDNERDADELADLVVAGRKRATAGSLWAYEAEGEPLPVAGDYSVITGWQGDARCIIRTTRVDVVPFAEVDEEFASTEGEGDGSLEYWRRGHTAYFRRELTALGMNFSEQMPVVCERFEVVFTLSDISVVTDDQHA